LAAVLTLLVLAPVLVKWDARRPLDWDEAHFASRALCLGRATWSLDLHGAEDCLRSMKKSPAMMLLAVPWGRPGTTEAGLGLLPVTLGILEVSLAVSVLLLLARLGIPQGLTAGAALVLTLTAPLRELAGRMMADLSFSLIVLLACLLVPLEARPGDGDARADVLRGSLWGTVLGLGLGQKMTFLVFGGVLLPSLVAFRWRARGAGSAWRTAAWAALFASPFLAITAIYWSNLYGHARLSASGSYAEFYSMGMNALQYLGSIVRSAPVLVAFSVVGAAALCVGLMRRRPAACAVLPGLAALLLYAAFVLASPNHDPRFAMPIEVALPFLLVAAWPRPVDGGPAGALQRAPLLLLVGVLLSIPAAIRYDFSNIADQARMMRGLPPGHHRLVLATDSPTLNVESLVLALELAPEKKREVGIDLVVYDEADGHDLRFSQRKIGLADYMILQSDSSRLWPDWTNRHVEAFREIARERGELVPELGSPDFEVFALNARAEVITP
jgi:hypothetical protein